MRLAASEEMGVLDTEEEKRAHEARRMVESDREWVSFVTGILVHTMDNAEYEQW